MWICGELVLWSNMRRCSLCFAGISRWHRSRTRISGLTRMLDTARSAFAANGSRLRHCTCAADFLEAQAQRQAAAFLSIEGAELLQTEAALQLALQAGVKIVTLTWNFDSVYGCGASTDDAAGLKPAGKQLAKTLAQHGVFLDVSHLSAKGFWDLADCIDAPILATHSNSRTVCNHPRNLTDEQFCEIIRRGGLVGSIFTSLCHSSAHGNV